MGQRRKKLAVLATVSFIILSFSGSADGAETTTTTTSSTTTTVGNVKTITGGIMVLLDNSEREIQARMTVFYSSGKDHRWSYNSDCSAQGTMSWEYTISPNHGSANTPHSQSTNSGHGFCGSQGSYGSFHQYGLTPGTTYTICATVSHTYGGSASACLAVKTLGGETSSTSATTSTTTAPGSSTPSSTTPSEVGGYMILIDTQSRAVQVMTKSQYDVALARNLLGYGGCGCFKWVTSGSSPSLGMTYDGSGGFVWPTTTTTTTTTSSTVPASGTTSTLVSGSTTTEPDSTTLSSSRSESTSTPNSNSISSSTISPAAPGTSEVQVGGTSVAVETSIDTETGSATITAGEVSAIINGGNTSIDEGDTPENALAFEAGSEVNLSASGFEPESEVAVIIYSEPTNLGQIKVDASGTVTAQVTLPDNLKAGNHTLVINGVDTKNEPISIKFGLIVYGTDSITPIWVWLLVAALTLTLLASVWLNIQSRQQASISPS